MTEQTGYCLVSPLNYGHKAGDGLKTREHRTTMIHPALQANPGTTQLTYLLEIYPFDEQNMTVGTLTTDGSTPKHNNRIIEVVCDED